MLILRNSGLIFAMMLRLSVAKIFDKCELALELRDRHSVPYDQIGIFVCVAERQSNFNTGAVGDGSYYGMYQLGSEFWCDVNYAGKGCGVQCSSLLDDDITDDIKCVQTIYDEHQRLFNNGWNAWPSAQYCQTQGNSFIQECLIEDNQIIKTYESVSRQQKQSGNVDIGKVYDRCELARELYYQHDIKMEHIATWVCIAKHESSYNTSAIGRLNWDGSEDHGLFQISDIYWCGESGKACGVQCSEMRDNDISNDVKCIKQIHAEHQRLSGDGFNAWAVYPRCKGTSKQYAEGCFDSDNEISREVMPYTPVPGIKQPTKTYVQSSQRKTVDENVEKGKVYDKCELAQELRYKYKIAMEQVATWVCIAKHESSFNTSAIGRLNADGSEDHGLFQISDIYWCSPPGKGTGCGVACSKFEDSDISDDVECMLKIYDEHQYLFGDGFNAWAVYRPHCQGRASSFIDGCFSNNEDGGISPRPAVTQPIRTTTYKPITTTTLRTTTTKSPSTTQTIKTTSYVAPITTKTTPRTTTKTSTTQAPKAVTTRTTKSIPSTPKPTTVKLTTTKTTTVTKRTSTNEPKTTTKAIRTSTNEDITTTPKFDDTTIIDTTIKTLKPDKTSTIKPSTPRSVKNSPTTVKSFNIFDLYFNSFPKGPTANKAIKPEVKNAVYKAPTTKATTKAPLKKSTKAYEINIRNEVNSQSTTRSTTLGNPYSKATTKSPSATTSKTSLINGVLKTTAALKTTTTQTTPRASQKTVRQSTLLQTKSQSRDTPTTKRKAATLKPFNLFDFYLNDYASRAPIVYKPLQFSPDARIIFKKDDGILTGTKAVLTVNRLNPITTTRRQEINFGFPSTTKSQAIKTLSIYNAFDDYSFNSNRIGRVVQNITPHSFDYLLRLTTPRTTFNRS